MIAVWWIGFAVFILAMLALDLGVFHRRAHEVKLLEAFTWTGVWVSLALLFNLGIYLGWIGPYPDAHAREQAALEFLTGYLIELSLSVDNVFVFALLFSYFCVPAEYRHRLLFWGILGAIIMRGGMIFAGVALLRRFHFVIYIFGAILIYAGIKMWTSKGVQIDIQNTLVLRLARRILPVSATPHGPRFTARENGKLVVTPLFVVLLLVEWTDLLFAVDSIPAVLAVTVDPFVVFTSNVMAILGLRSLFFALAGAMERFHLLHYGLAAVLVFVGTKMMLVHFYKIPTVVALCVVAGILALSILVSLFWPRPGPENQSAGAIPVHPQGGGR